MNKIGRPISNDPRKNIVGCKLTDKELQELERYCHELQIKKSELIREGIDKEIHKGETLWR